ALSPAWEASLVTPVDAMARGRREYETRVHRWRDLALAVVLAACAWVAWRKEAVGGKPMFGYFAAILLIAASACAIPALVSGSSRAMAGILRRLFGVEALLATRSLAGSLRRTSVLVGALATAIAMLAAVGIMVGSFRQTIVVWMNDQLPADLYLRPAGDESADRHPTMSPEFVDALAKLPGVAAGGRYRAYEISYQGLPATLAGADLQVMRDFRSSDFVSGRAPDKVLDEMRRRDAAIISEPFSNKHRVHAGQSIKVPLGGRNVSLRIVDVYYDYASERGVIVLDRETLLHYLPDPAPSNLAVYVQQGANVNAVRQEIEFAAAGRNVLVFTDRDLRREAIRIFDRPFAIPYALDPAALFFDF